MYITHLNEEHCRCKHILLAEICEHNNQTFVGNVDVNHKNWILYCSPTLLLSTKLAQLSISKALTKMAMHLPNAYRRQKKKKRNEMRQKVTTFNLMGRTMEHEIVAPTETGNSM